MTSGLQKSCKIIQGAKRTHKYKTLVEFTFNYHKDLGSDIHFEHIG